MYYKLKEHYRLRGWERLPHALQDIKTGNTHFIDETAFQAVSFCNGLMDVDSPLFLPAHKKVIVKLKENGIIKECSYGEGLNEEQKYKLIPCRYIRQAHWSITGKCNLKCRHCYMSAPRAKYGELSLEQCLEIVQQLYEAGISTVSLTGGEPLVRKDFFKIVDALSDQNIIISQIYFIPVYKAAGAPLNLMLGGFFYCRKGNEDYNIPCKKYDGSEKMLKQTVCMSARTTMYITADGKLLPCIPLTGLSVQDDMPDITKMPLSEALSDSAYLNLIDTRLKDLMGVNENCRACEHSLYCGGGCRAGALVSSGEYLGCDEYTCYFFKNNYEAKIQASWR